MWLAPLLAGRVLRSAGDCREQLPGGVGEQWGVVEGAAQWQHTVSYKKWTGLLQAKAGQPSPTVNDPAMLQTESVSLTATALLREPPNRQGKPVSRAGIAQSELPTHAVPSQPIGGHKRDIVAGGSDMTDDSVVVDQRTRVGDFKAVIRSTPERTLKPTSAPTSMSHDLFVPARCSFHAEPLLLCQLSYRRRGDEQRRKTSAQKALFDRVEDHLRRQHFGQ